MIKICFRKQNKKHFPDKTILLRRLSLSLSIFLLLHSLFLHIFFYIFSFSPTCVLMHALHIIQATIYILSVSSFCVFLININDIYMAYIMRFLYKIKQYIILNCNVSHKSKHITHFYIALLCISFHSSHEYTKPTSLFFFLYILYIYFKNVFLLY